MTPEGKVKAAVKKILAAHGAYFFMPVSNGMGAMGVFDIVCCVASTFVGVECKSDASKKPTALQSKNAAKCRAAGGVVFLAHKDNLMVLDDTIRRIVEGRDGLDGCSLWPADRTDPDNEG